MLLKEYINYQVASVLLEIRGTFKWNEFKALSTLDQKLQYAQQHLKELGRGSSRAAFLLSNRYVLKIALPQAAEKGMGQNKGELQVFANTASKNYVTAIHDAGEDGHWLVSEIARPLASTEEFQKLTGVPWEQFVSILKNHEDIKSEFSEIEQGIQMWSRRLKNAQSQGNEAGIDKFTKNVQNLQQRKTNLQKMLNSPVVQGALALMNQAGVMRGDILEVDHWGKTADGRVVLLDYGFTEDLVDLYRAA